MNYVQKTEISKFYALICRNLMQFIMQSYKNSGKCTLVIAKSKELIYNTVTTNKCILVKFLTNYEYFLLIVEHIS